MILLIKRTSIDAVVILPYCVTSVPMQPFNFLFYSTFFPSYYTQLYYVDVFVETAEFRPREIPLASSSSFLTLEQPPPSQKLTFAVNGATRVCSSCMHSAPVVLRRPFIPPRSSIRRLLGYVDTSIRSITIYASPSAFFTNLNNFLSRAVSHTTWHFQKILGKYYSLRFGSVGGTLSVSGNYFPQRSQLCGNPLFCHPSDPGSVPSSVRVNGRPSLNRYSIKRLHTVYLK